jgi:hypothetical protein
MTEPDTVIDLLRRARPEGPSGDLVSPHSPGAVAILEEVLATDRDRRPGGRPRRRVLLPAAAAAAAVAVAAAVLVAPGSDQPSAAATLDAALAQTSDLLGRSGRAEWRSTLEVNGQPPFAMDGEPVLDPWTAHFEFSGPDVAVDWNLGGDGGPYVRIVDGAFYDYGQFDPITGERSSDPSLPWTWRVTSLDEIGDGPFPFDPRTLVETMGSAGDFELVGTEVVDGIPTERLRATAPDQALDAADLRRGVEGDVVRLEVWVDGDDLVRRIEFEIAEAFGLEGERWRSSIELYDLGEPVTIEAPPVTP